MVCVDYLKVMFWKEQFVKKMEVLKAFGSWDQEFNSNTV